MRRIGNEKEPFDDTWIIPPVRSQNGFGDLHGTHHICHVDKIIRKDEQIRMTIRDAAFLVPDAAHNANEIIRIQFGDLRQPIKHRLGNLINRI